MNISLLVRNTSRIGAACAVAAVAITAMAGSSQESFLAENDLAMKKMMAGMAIKSSGDVDHDFANMMIPHHQGAIDMAEAELRYGHNEQLRRLAQEIIVDQQQEMAAMRLALGEALPEARPVPTGPEAEASPSDSSSDVKPLHSEHHP